MANGKNGNGNDVYEELAKKLSKTESDKTLVALFSALKKGYDAKLKLYDDVIDLLKKNQISLLEWRDGHKEQHKRDLTIIIIILSVVTIATNIVVKLL